MLSDNFMALEPLLLDRLEQHFASAMPASPQKVRVLSAADLALLKDGTQPTPSVSIIYQGYKVIDVNPSGLAARIEQTWLAWVSTKNVADMRGGAPARNTSGQLGAQVLYALMGFKPPLLSKPLRLINAPPASFANGIGHCPFAFAAEILINQPQK